MRTFSKRRERESRLSLLFRLYFYRSPMWDTQSSLECAHLFSFNVLPLFTTFLLLIRLLGHLADISISACLQTVWRFNLIINARALYLLVDTPRTVLHSCSFRPTKQYPVGFGHVWVLLPTVNSAFKPRD